MKSFFLCLIVVMVVLSPLTAQVSDPKPGTAIPSFRILKTNGSYFTNNDISKNAPFVLIYFAPDCDHCMKMIDELFKKIHQLDKANIVLVTFKAPNELPPFEKKYQIAQYPNITVGTEGTTYVLRNYYRLNKTPFTAVYDKKGKLAFSYKNETPVNEMLQRFKKI
jgi:thiol-disulfide isomerase/thioredoxin